VLATLHTNDAVSAVTRLTDMGVEPFLLSSSLLGVLAQRLVRKLCPVCKLGSDPDFAKRNSGSDPNFLAKNTSYHPGGCEACGRSGYKGRTGIYELLTVNDQVRALIHGRAAESQLLAAGEAAGLSSMRADGERLVQLGITSREELLRVTRD
jgi:general secretion pathway protein E